jgi:hypothetical protein
MNTTIWSASVDREPTGESPAGVPVLRASRILGAGVAAVIAVAAALIAAGLNGGWLFALGIPAATVSGWALGPSVRNVAWPLGATMGMAALTVALADAIAVATIISSGGGYATDGVDPISATAFIPVASAVIWLFGFIVVGLPALAITIPCAAIWSLVVRSLIRRAVGVRHVDQGSIG